jgi:hypothetical protein
VRQLVAEHRLQRALVQVLDQPAGEHDARPAQPAGDRERRSRFEQPDGRGASAQPLGDDLRRARAPNGRGRTRRPCRCAFRKQRSPPR